MINESSKGDNEQFSQPNLLQIFLLLNMVEVVIAPVAVVVVVKLVEKPAIVLNVDIGVVVVVLNIDACVAVVPLPPVHVPNDAGLQTAVIVQESDATPLITEPGLQVTVATVPSA
jgi:hypothetical protein